MKLSEALILRADYQKRIAQLRQRLTRNAQIQEGEAPAEDPQTLLLESRQTIDALTLIIRQINKTNALTPFRENLSLTDALAERDGLMLQRNILTELIQAAAAATFRYRQAEIKFLRAVDVQLLQKQADDLAKQYRELDTAIQALNWQVDLIEN